MTDIFISYASEDRARAGQLAAAFEARGWSVWWDRRIVPGQAFDAAIESALEAAGCVVVLWSPDAAASEWVKNEAAAGAERGALVPAMIVDVKLPLEFRRKQTADLTRWRGDAADAGFAALCDGVARAIGGDAIPPELPPAAQLATRSWLRPAAIALVVLAGVVLSQLRPSPVPAPSPAAPQTAPDQALSLAAQIAGSYVGDVIADSQGPSQSDVRLTLTAIDPRTVRITADYPRIAPLDVPLTRVGGQVQAAGGDTVLIVDPHATPPTIDYAPHNALRFTGRRQ